MQIPSFMCFGTIVIVSSIRKIRKRTTWTKCDNNFCYNLDKKWYFSEIFGTQITFDMICLVKSLKVKLT